MAVKMANQVESATYRCLYGPCYLTRALYCCQHCDRCRGTVNEDMRCKHAHEKECEGKEKDE